MNYIIRGTSRCGKTMLANMITQKLVGYNKLSTDNFIGAFHKVMPELEINHNSGKGMKKIFPEFLLSYINSTKKKDNKLDLYYVLEGVDISDEILEEFNKQDDVTVICLSKPSLTREEYFKEVRYFEKIYLYGEWTKALSDKELYKYVDYWLNEANQIKKMCEEKGYLFFDTSYNQEKVIKGIFKKIKRSNAKNLQRVKKKKVVLEAYAEDKRK